MTGGLIVAGGRSTRFGEEDKAVADLAGTPMIRRVADRIAPVVDELVVNCRDDQVDPIAAALDGYPIDPVFAEDPEPDQGPMAGIMTGLRATESEYAVVVACDMPFVEPGLLTALLDNAGGHDAAVPKVGEWFQTTQAAYRSAAMADACEAALERDERRIVAPLNDLDYVTVPESELTEYASLETFDNLNTREEFEAAVERFSMEE